MKGHWWMNKGKWLLVGCFIVALLNSCKDNTGTLGPQVLPKVDLISAYETDTSTVLTSMCLKDSVNTNDQTSSPLGSYFDPIFGETKASIYAQVYPSTLIGCPFDTSVVDSVLLLLPLNQGSYYGNLDPQTFLVYQTDTNIVSETSYYSNANLKYNPTPIGSAQVTPNPFNDTLKIKLSKSWWYPLSNILQTGNYWTNINPILKGLYITTSNPIQLPGQGAILYVNMNTSFAEIFWCYHSNRLASAKGNTSFTLGGADGTYFANVQHNYSSSPFGGIHPVGKHDSIPANQLMYVQSMAGLIGKVDFPNLYKNWAKKGPIIINEAELVVNVDAQQQGNYSAPSELILLGIDSTWGQYAVPDYYQSYYGGVPTGTSSGTSYTMVITEYIQSVINGKTVDRGLYILPNNYPSSANRVVLYGAQHNSVQTGQRVTLIIYYTPVKPK